MRGSWRRLQLARALSADTSRDPFYRARLAQLAGPVLVADALTDLDCTPGRRAPRLGLWGGVLLSLLGGLALLGGVVELREDAADTYRGGRLVTGYVTDQGGELATIEYRNPRDRRADYRPDGELRCAPTVSYTLDGVSYSVTASDRAASSCLPEGTAVELSYRAGDPAAALPQLPEDDEHTLRGGLVRLLLGSLVLAFGLATCALRAAAIRTGTELARWGRSSRDELPDPERSTARIDAEIIAELQRSWALPGRLSSYLTELARQRDPALPEGPVLDARGHPLPAAQLPLHQRAADEDEPPAVAPDWYPDPDGEGLRWWDGGRWTAHEKPAPDTPPHAQG